MFVYVLSNAVNGKRYVGQTNNLENRFRQHRSNWSKLVIAQAIRKYGWESFKADSCEVDSLAEANELEEFLISELACRVTQHGYNIDRGGDNHIRSRSTRKKISEALKGRVLPPESHAKRAEKLRGRKHTKEHRKKISESNKGHVVTAETRAKISAANKGKKRTREQVEAMRQRLIGKKASKETRAKMRAAHSGKKYPDRKQWTPEMREKHSETMKAWWEGRKGER